MTTVDRTELIRSAFEAMVREFGKPSRRPIPYRNPAGSTVMIPMPDNPENDEIHPVFVLSRHFRSRDDYERGYTENPYRGDHISIPAYLGFSQEIAIFETSFHKGQAFIEVVTFPEADRDSALYKAALNLLDAEETR
ncbi:MAG: hypothetical protein QM708_05720 [Propioniciclava sp.]|uniref:hypothetical protein n=1 Tax=Propioniciclava sp. TaxID=2038686 RepID=UPI0039E4BF34